MQTQDSKFPIEELYTLYSLGKEPALDALWQSGERSSVLASMLSSWHLRQGNAKAASDCLPFVRDPEERALKHQSIRFLPKLRAPLKPEPRVHLLLLVHNRIGYVEEALRLFAATEYTNYAVYILDNGSTDGSADVVARAKEYFPAHVPVHSVVMPLNLGRPLGHNWLLSQFDHSAAAYVAIGDDDLVAIPPGWMGDMVRTFSCFPRTALVGCKALALSQGKVVCAGAKRLTRFSALSVDYSNSENEPDIGQQDYVDLVDHAIGCLHMYKKEVFFDGVGLFDLRYSPCQYVDVDHHTSMRLKDMLIVYNGFIEVSYAPGMGEAARQDKALKGNSDGNRIKLVSKHGPEAVKHLIDKSRQDLARRVAAYS